MAKKEVSHYVKRPGRECRILTSLYLWLKTCCRFRHSRREIDVSYFSREDPLENMAIAERLGRMGAEAAQWSFTRIRRVCRRTST